MKKSRPGTLVTVLCDAAIRDSVLSEIFRHTSTIGVREYALTRHTLDRRVETVSTRCGDIRRKISEGFGVRRVKWEHDDLERAARELDVPVSRLRELLRAEYTDDD